jgi:hypothetical protein
VSALLTVGAIKAARNNAPRRAVPDNEPLLAKR